ncbi:VPA1269 family protein [Pseudomonas [fluorescens] ATCC 17400]
MPIDFESLFLQKKTLTHLVDMTLESIDKSKPNFQRLYGFEFLASLWAKGWILFPLNLPFWAVNRRWELLSTSTFTQEKANLIRSIYTPTSSAPIHGGGILPVLWTFLCTTSVNEKEDISKSLMDDFETAQVAYIKKTTKNDPDTTAHDALFLRNTKAMIALGRAHNMIYLDDQINITKIKRGGGSQTTEEPRTDGNFKWLTAQNPALSGWAETFSLYIKSITNARAWPFVNALNHLGDYLCTLPNPPTSPWEVSRNEHIHDVRLINRNTFINYLTSKNHTVRSGNYTLSVARRYFNWTKDYLISLDRIPESRFPNPVLESDGLGKREKQTKTQRDSLPPYLVNEMKETLTENDFAFPKTYQQAYVIVHDSETGYSVNQYYPGFAICMYALLDTPIRSHQGRWLDSGNLDERIYDPETNTMVHNPSPYAIVGRQEGVLSVRRDAYRDATWVALWVNTNKTAEYRSEKIGYSIPYVSPELQGLLTKMSVWEKRYLPPLTKPLSYRAYQKDVRYRSENIVRGPEVVPLFRDPFKPNQDEPFDYARLKRMYTNLLAAVEQRIWHKYGQRLTLVTEGQNGQKKWAVDLHSLRVSGITNLIEAGVPIEIVSEFVAGHQVLVMTLHYLKYSPAKIREFIQGAYDRMVNDQNFVGSEVFIKALEDFLPYLVTQDGTGSGAGMEYLQNGDGIIVVNPDGICPGTSCSTGGAALDSTGKKFGPVPGGKRCGLCRWWITGPAHLLGQVNAVNNLGYTIRKKGLEVASLNEQRLEAEDSGDQSKARHLRDRIDLLNRELVIDVNEWAARYQYAEKSLALMDAYLETKRNIIATDAHPVPMMTGSTDIELEITLKNCHEFELLDQITQTARFATGFKNHQAEIEKNQVLSRMMVSNGITPFLLTLNEEQAHEAGNMLSALILQQVSSSDLDEVFNGKKPLSHYPNLHAAIRTLESSLSSGLIVTDESISALAEILSNDESPRSGQAQHFGSQYNQAEQQTEDSETVDGAGVAMEGMDGDEYEDSDEDMD